MMSMKLPPAFAPGPPLLIAGIRWGLREDGATLHGSIPSRSPLQMQEKRRRQADR